MRPVIMEFSDTYSYPNILKDRFDHFVVVLYQISYEDNDPDVVTPTFNHILTKWKELYRKQGKKEAMLASNWLFDERQVSQAIREFLHAVDENYDSWTRRMSRGHEFKYNHEVLTDLILCDRGSRSFRITPHDLRSLLAPHSTIQHDVAEAWEILNRYVVNADGTPIKWREDVGLWL